MLHFALIGCGRIAVRHAENITRVGKLIAVCDLDKEKAGLIANQYQAKAFTMLEEVLASSLHIDVIVICTPNGFHADQCIRSLEAGKNVLCEKPMCLTSKEAIKIIEAEKCSGKKLFVVKSMRFNPLIKTLQRMIIREDLGCIYSFQLCCFWNRSKEYYKDWHGKKFPDGGTLFTQFSHYIDAMLWLFGDIEKANGFSTNAAHTGHIEFEDTGVAALEFKNGILGTLNWSVNTYKKNFEIGLSIIAEKGTIAIAGEFLNSVKYQSVEKGIWLESLDNLEERKSLSYHREVYDNLILSLSNGEHNFTNSKDGMKTVAAIELIYSSITKN